ncbi:MAG: hypothetical protein LQ343_002594 [Gyalolechia ehrenbergii]|nr:MAG: hypothetical protein LQ343_002594 [Gyalolechia ehrenbergii]
MDPVFKIPASPGTPLFPVSPERANRQALPQSPSLPCDLHDPFKSAHLRENSDVQNKVAQFNSLSKEAVQRRKDNEAAMRRAVLGREEAESETRRLKDENRVLRKELEEGWAREKRVAERIESVMEELHKTKETQAHAQGVYEKEVRRARKEAFKSSSALVKLQEEMKTTRKKYTLMREESETQKRRVESKEQETFTAQYQLVGLQGELESTRQAMKVIEEERDALKTSLKQEEVARIAAEGKIGLSPSQGPDELATPKKRRGGSLKRNVHPEAMDPEEISPLDALEEELRFEKKLRARADDLIEFMNMECQFQCCPCRIAEEEGTEYIHDGTYNEKIEKNLGDVQRRAKAAVPQAIPPPERSGSSPRSPARAPSPLGQTTEMLINFSPSASTFSKILTPAKRDFIELPSLPKPDSDPKTASEAPIHLSSPSTLHQPSPQRPHQQAQFFAPQTPRTIPAPPQQAPQTKNATIRSVTFPRSTTTTTTVPLAPIPVSPDRTISRDEALEQIRQRRGRARSAAGNGTPRKVPVEKGERRDLSAPAR